MRAWMILFLSLALLLLFCGSSQGAFTFQPLDEYIIQLHGEPGGSMSVAPLTWPYSWNPNTNVLSLLNGYMGPDWYKVFSIELWTSGGTFNPNTTTIPAANWVEIAEAYGTVPGGTVDGFCNISWETCGQGWHYGFRGYICPQPEGEAFDFSTLLSGGGHIGTIDLRTSCIPGPCPCVPEPASLLSLMAGIVGLGFVLKRR